MSIKFTSDDGFEITKFNSGEWDVKIIDTKNPPDIIHWNWFKEPDIIIPLQKITCLKYVFGPDMSYHLYCPYLPYSRQDRVFCLGNCIPLKIIISVLLAHFDVIRTMCIHNDNYLDLNRLKSTYLNLYLFNESRNVVFPDAHAKDHFTDYRNYLSFIKFRANESVFLELNSFDKSEIDHDKPFLICDDICDGGRTFIECAKVLQKTFGQDIKIELLLAHGFMTYGLDPLIKAGISKIYIANDDSYDYLKEKFNNVEDDYLTLLEFI